MQYTQGPRRLRKCLVLRRNYSGGWLEEANVQHRQHAAHPARLDRLTPGQRHGLLDGLRALGQTFTED